MKTFLLFFLTLLMSGFLTAQTFYHTGNEEPVETDHLPGLVLAGGAGDNDDAMQWMLERADGGDVVVLRASGSDLYNNYFYSQLGVVVNSVTTIVVTSSGQANNEEVVESLNNAEVVFIAGGNQWNYVNHWRDTQLLETLNFLINEKQITVGGTSAGMAVLGEVVFTAENQTVWSSEALGNPYHWRVKLEKDFLEVPFMQNTVTDTHYNAEESDGNDRKGRHVAFMSRMVADWEMPARGIAANEYTAIAVDETGKARVFGHPSYPDFGYFLQKYGGPPEVCEEGEPLTWYQDKQAVRVYKVKGDFEGSGWFDIGNWEDGEGGEWQFWYVDEGVLYETGSDDDTSLVNSDVSGLEVFPNPASSAIRVISALGIAEAALITLDGKVLLQKEGNGATELLINLDHLPVGSYLLRVLEGARYHIHHVTIVR